MGLSGKYDFQGIKKLNALEIKAVLATSPATAWLLKAGATLDPLWEFIGNFLANKGLVLFNMGAIFVNGVVDQHAFDKSLDDGWKQVETGRDKLTPAQGRAIDDQVRMAARKFIRLNPS